MRFGFVHRLMTDALALLGILALVTSGKLGVVVNVVTLVATVVAIFLPEKARQSAILKLASTVVPIAFLALQLARLALGAEPIGLVVEFAAGLQIVRLATRRGALHDHQVILLALLHLIAGTILGGGLAYALSLLGFLVFTPGALVLSHLRREVEGNYKQGARDRTGLPVDVPRILRSRRVIGKGFLLFTCLLSVPVFVLTAVIFMAFPRVGFSWWNVTPTSSARVAGFSDRVDLGGVGTIRTDPTLVMRVVPPGIGDDPPRRRNLYLRGAVFDNYSGSSWARTVRNHQARDWGIELPLHRYSRATDAVMKIHLESIEPLVVFYPDDAVTLKLKSKLRMPKDRGTSFTIDAFGRIEYRPPSRNGVDYRVFLERKHFYEPSHLELEEKKYQQARQAYLQLPTGLSPEVRELAQRLTEGAETPREKATLLEKNLRNQYIYDLTSTSGRAEDPLEDFLFQTKRGHCEFFSTSMAILLRTLGVPTRNVTGYVGGTYNRFGEFYAVRQGDAHSWVEVYLPKVGWTRFDPTPPAAVGDALASRGVWNLMRDMMEAAAEGWDQNVVGFNLQKQLAIVRSFRQSTQKAKNRVKSFPLSTNWRLLGLVGAALLGAGVAAMIYLQRKSSSAIQDREQEKRSIELYQELDQALRRTGIPRPSATPPLTYAVSLEEAGHPLGEKTLGLTRRYLLARYGHEPFTEPEAEDFLLQVQSLAVAGAADSAEDQSTL
ncbi:MAG: transglutaminaseTgpA domain-containing protein [Polyangiaceae bacterium]|nr:transglutaminaseTgpA domain-containing protein [Polyangiaceae bacterium]